MKNALTKAALFVSLLLVNLFRSTAIAQTQLDPNSQIRWTTPIISAPGPQTKFLNNTPQADSFPGADMCQKINNAAIYAIGSGFTMVDASHFAGTQACNYNMFANLPTPGTGTPGTPAAGNANVNLAITFGTVLITTTVQQHITQSGIALIGIDPFQTQMEYTGSSPDAQGILYVDGTTGTGSLGSNGLNGFKISGFYIYGNSNATDALQMVQTHRSKVEDVSLWGVTGCGLHTLGAVTDTFTRVHVSVTDAYYNGIQGGSYPYPAHGKCFDQYGSNKTTNGTVTDAIDEGVTSSGWDLIAANSMHFSAGTSESNGYGINVAAGSKWNVFDSPDIEQNTANVTGVDVNDQGQSTVYINPIFASTCTGGCTHSATFGTGGGQYIIGESGAATTWTGSVNIIGVNTAFTNGSFAVPAPSFGSIAVTSTITNSQGLQSIAATGCTITSGAIGNQCSTTITFTSWGGVAMANSSYHTVCTGSGGSGLWTVGNATSATTTSVVIPSVALSTTATGGGYIACILSQ